MSDYNQPPQQPNYPQQPAYGQGYPAVAENPGKTLGIVGLVLSFFLGLVGTIISIVALRKSRKAGFGNVPAVIGIILGILVTLFWIGLFVFIGFAAKAAYDQILAACAGLPAGSEVRIQGTEVACPPR